MVTKRRDARTSYTPRKPCAYCNVRYAVRQDGKMRKHRDWVDKLVDRPDDRCPGSGQPPWEV